MTAPAALLDVDGTLVDTNYHHALAWYRAFRSEGLTLPLWRIHRHMGMGGDQLVASLGGDELERKHGDAVREVDHYLDLLDVRKLVAGWTTSADVEATKPKPDLVQAGIEKAGGGAAVMVGDSTWDVESARRAGVETIGVLTGGYSEAELRDAGAAGVFETLPELRERLGETPLTTG